MTSGRRTEDVILDLAARPIPGPLPAAGAAGGILAGILLSVGAFLFFFGPRPDLAAALSQVPVLAKSVLPLLLAVLSAVLALASLRPGARLALWLLALPVLPGLVMAAQRIAKGDGLLTETLGQTALACAFTIPILALPAIAAGLVVMRSGAPTRPALTGALTGLAAGAGAAGGYALHCTEDSALFFVAWYGLGMVTAASFGAWAGRRLLRW
jgi:hypothetical protein